MSLHTSVFRPSAWPRHSPTESKRPDWNWSAVQNTSVDKWEDVLSHIKIDTTKENSTVEHFNNQQLIQIGDTAADLLAQVEANKSDSSEDKGKESDVSFALLSRTSSFSSILNAAAAMQSSITALPTAAAESEF
ncbi:uncharacterized protein PHACADRAFT_190933 [Phanerochaete carnosa HHB-10118-sp]|uniref:Uncharacterized protein n=1 Tax=Phanerochaete carnosa (strain HHB-10118-sp) TaxID=650164 RepID=K5VFE3_PHACS|nr:uncharacterized protein PHACADRAFT_190933 [Phanerochaete carnosa HHB-10118-sp]EKM61746.1 hypothetical protein PHACADRAFT_190933 [Phanerochaete carnosa HHB-10118-sp]